jgi:Protein of unknown function (DUF1186)
MSKRKRHPQKGAEVGQIEWLKHRTGYPAPEEREEIIRLRQELSIELVSSMVMGGRPDKAQIQALVRKYSQKEVEHAVNKFDRTFGELPAFVADDARSYREYRLRYARFGAGLKFYTSREIDELYEKSLNSVKESDDLKGASELDRLLLFGWRDWEDITPPAIPPRPDDFTAPKPASYPAPINELLERGDDLDRSHDFVDEADFMRWRKHIPTLTRMALDPGLVNGWPTESGSWAPWHAIHVLGVLQAWESAPALAAIADFENDWLSDHLPHIWADMGMQVEPSLWMILENPSASEKQRGLAAESFKMMSEDNEAVAHKVIDGFEKILKNTKTFNPAVNAYLIRFINQMEVADEIEETIQQAFEDERVDLDIITPEDLEEDDFDDDYDEDVDMESDDDEEE